MNCKGKIDVVEHSAYIAQTARSMKREFPSIALEDIQSELVLLILEYQNQYDPEKGKITTFIATYPARKLRQALIYKYIDFTYDNERNRIFVETCSINSPINNEPDAPDYLNLLELVEANENNEYSSNLDSSSVECDNMLSLLDNSSLDSREKEIIVKRFGLNGKAPMTLEEIGKELNITREYVRVLEKRAKEKLQKNARLQEMY